MKRNIAAACFAILFVAPLAWMAADRDPPYIRGNGTIVESDNPKRDCAVTTEVQTGVRPGACVGVHWPIQVVRNCPPASTASVKRELSDSAGVRWELVNIEGIYGTTKTPPPSIVRYFRIPAGAASGPAIYISSARYACNPLQRYIWPIVVDTPNIRFIIEGKL